MDEEDAVGKVLKDFDTSLDAKVSFEEFLHGVRRWLEVARGSKPHSKEADPGTFKYLNDFHEQTKRDHYLLGDQRDEVVEDVENSRWTTINAVFLLGSVTAVAFADPLVDAVHNFSSATIIPSFFISFIVFCHLQPTPVRAVSAIIFASSKKLRSASLTFPELYGAATMNNVLCLSVFL